MFADESARPEGLYYRPVETLAGPRSRIVDGEAVAY
jgi:hypothetical protein